MERTEIREDLENLYNWDRIEETYNTVDNVETLTRRFTLNDNGTSKDETVVDEPLLGMTFNRVTYLDAPNGDGTAPWDRIDRYTSDDLGTFYQVIHLDDGQIRHEFFSTEEGAVNGHVTFDNPLPRNDEVTALFFDPTTLHRGLYELVPGDTVPAGATNWYSYYVYEDPDDGSINTNIDRDDFARIFEKRIDGNLTERTLQDISTVNGREHIHAWDYISETFDNNGVIEFRQTYYDDGSVKDEGFLNGVISFTHRFDGNGEDNGVQPWSRIDTGYDEFGVIEFRNTSYDDGTFRDEGYLDGVISFVRQFDGNGEDNGVRPWSNIETLYDPEGQIVFRGTVNDDGTTREETYENGVLRSVVQYDNPSESHDGVEPWSRIGTLYDETGKRISKTIVNDDGSEKIETFQNGIRTRVEVAEERPGTFGGPFLELIFAADYDADTGELTDRYTMNVDGSSRTETFDNGNLQSVTQVDSNPSSNIWRTIETLFVDGSISERTTAFDIGEQRIETFADGRVASFIDSSGSFLENPPTVCVFSGDGCPNSGLNLRLGIDQRETIFGDDGLVAVRRTYYSDGDQTAALYENNRIYEQQLYDGDGDQAWLARSLLYDASGAITDSIEFYSEAEIPLDFFVPVQRVGPVDVPIDTDLPPSVDTFTPGDGSGGGISVTAGSGVTTIPVETDMTPPDLDDFVAGGIAVNAGSGLTLTGGGSSPTPSATTFESMDAGPDLLDLM